MAPHPSFALQYQSMESMMRCRFAVEFPDLDVSELNTLLLDFRRGVDGSGRTSRYTYDERRYMGEQKAWSVLWPREIFPGVKPASAAELVAMDLLHGNQQYGSHHGRCGRRGRGRTSHRFDGRDRGTVSTRGRGPAAFGGRGDRGSRHNGRGNGRIRGRINFGSLNTNERSISTEQEGVRINLNDDTLSLERLSLATVETPNTQLSGSKALHAPTITCLQCGIIGHPELDCPYEVTVMQGLDRERYLVCGTPGHIGFEFSSQKGCLGCKDQREEAVKVVTETIEVAGTSRWQELDYEELVCRSKVASSDGSVQVVTSALQFYNIDAHIEREFEIDDEDIEVIENAEPVADSTPAEDDEEFLIQL